MGTALGRTRCHSFCYQLGDTRGAYSIIGRDTVKHGDLREWATT